MAEWKSWMVWGSKAMVIYDERYDWMNMVMAAFKSHVKQRTTQKQKIVSNTV